MQGCLGNQGPKKSKESPLAPYRVICSSVLEWWGPYIFIRKSNTSLGFFPGSGISSAAASLNWDLNMALNTGELMLNIRRWTWNCSFSTTRITSLSSHGSAKQCLTFSFSCASWTVTSDKTELNADYTLTRNSKCSSFVGEFKFCGLLFTRQQASR